MIMWLPKTEKEIVDAVTSGSLEESSIFDAKKELPSKNLEIAKDIASMANDGGTIIFGIDEDENKRLTILNPIPLSGQAERIDNIVRTSIAEPLQIQINSIPTSKDQTKGYLVIFIPPSERAPHMVVVKGDNRFYGRSATGNVPLLEGEVARLYARRDKTEIDRMRFLDNEIATCPLEPNQNFAYMYLFARPVFAKEGFFDAIFKGGKNFQTILNDLIAQVYSDKVYQHKYSPDFKPPVFWKQRVDGLFGQMGNESSNPERIPAQTLNLQIDFNGNCHLFCGRAGEKISEKQPFYIFTGIVAGLTIRFINLVAKLNELSAYIGMVDIGVGLTGLKGSVFFLSSGQIDFSRTPYDQDIYKKTGRFSNQIILENSLQTSEYLINPFVNAISQGQINPFK